MRVIGSPHDPTRAMWQTVPSLDMTHWIARSEIDLILLDMEHGDFQLQSIRHATWLAHGLDTGVIVRLPGESAHLAGVVLDQGVDGVVLPSVESSIQVEQLFKYALHHPRGRRGLSANGYASPSASSESALIGIQLESTESVSAAPKILDGGPVDFVMPGPRDLAARAGHAGGGRGTETAAAMAEIFTACEGRRIATIMPVDHDATPHWAALAGRASVHVIGHDHSLVSNSLGESGLSSAKAYLTLSTEVEGRLMLKRLWNVGSKTSDLEGDIRFFRLLGAEVLAEESVTVGDTTSDYAMVAIAGTRVFLAPEPAFETQLSQALKPGLTHAVFIVDSIEAAVDEVALAGGHLLIPASRVVGAFGDRTIAFMESPGGLILELAELHTNPLEGDTA